MARVPITIYKKSFLASFVSIVGSIMMVLGICLLFEELVAGIICTVIGIGFLLWAPIISERKLFKLWIKDLKTKGVIDMLPSSRDLCLQMYQANPKKRTIKFIAKYNPSIAVELSSALTNSAHTK